MHQIYRHELIYCLFALLIGLLSGWFSDDYLWGSLIALLIYLSWHFYQILRLNSTILSHHHLHPPFLLGLWGNIYQEIYRNQQRSRKRKRGLMRFTARFRDTAMAIPDALVIIDKRLTINWANAASKSLLGFDWPQVDGKSIIELVGNSKLLNYIQQGTYNQPIEIVPLHNKALVLSIRVTPFGGKKHQRLLIARDITQIHNLNQIRRDFVANVSHELRTPLTIINGYVENMLDMESIPEDLRHPLQRMYAQTSQMATLLQNLLALSKLELAEKASKQVPIEVASMLEAIAMEAEAMGPEHHLEINADPELWLIADEIEIQSAFSNLIFNAIKHTRAGTEIKINWFLESTGACFAVYDNGDGIASEHIPRLTERFYRIDKGRSRASGGTGLGLAIVKHILTRHDAELHISSNIGQGSSFICRFPHTAHRKPPP